MTRPVTTHVIPLTCNYCGTEHHSPLSLNVHWVAQPGQSVTRGSGSIVLCDDSSACTIAALTRDAKRRHVRLVVAQ